MEALQYALIAAVIIAAVIWYVVSLARGRLDPAADKKRRLLIESTEVKLIDAELDLESHQASVNMLRARLARLKGEVVPHPAPAEPEPELVPPGYVHALGRLAGTRS